MIQIIENGKPLKKYKVVYTIGCPNCGCKFCCEKEDFREIEKTPNGLHTIDCPWCEHELQLRLAEMKTELVEIKELEPVVVPTPTPLPTGGYEYPDCNTCPYKPDPSKWWIAGDTPCTFCKKMQPTCVSKEK